MDRGNDFITTADAGEPPLVARRLPEIDRYVLLEQIGAGGMGVVYAAYDSQLDRKVALKLLPEHQVGAAYQDRLRREARALAQLSHPNVMPVYDVGETRGRVFFAMEFVRGTTLAAWTEREHPVAEIVEVGRAIAAGLAAAHAIALVHRDVKPGNILIGDDGRVRVADFGLAHADESARALGSPHSTGVAGTPAYMAPEQLRGERIDARADQFALCVMLYELLHGARPFVGETRDERLAAIAAGPPAATRAVPAGVTAAIARGMAADPEARFSDLHAFAAALEPPHRSRRWFAFGALALVLVLATTGGGLALHAEAARAPRCALEATEIDAVWGIPQRAALAAALGGEGGERVAARLDEYATTWRDRSTAVCRATRVDHAWTPELGARATRCLDDRRDELARVVVALVGTASLDGATASDVVSHLRAPTMCADPDYLRSALDLGIEVAPALHAVRAAIQDEVQSLLLVRALGHRAEVERALPGLRARIAAAGDDDGRARLAQLEGELARDRDDPAAAIRLHTTAYLAARAARDPIMAAAAAASVAWDHGMLGEDLARAGDWAALAKAESASLGDHEVGISVHYTLGALADRRGDIETAIAEFQRAVDLAEREFGSSHAVTATMDVALAAVLGASGRFTEAVPRHRAGLVILERWAGPRSPALIRPLGNLALTESSAALPREAEADARRAVALADASTTHDLRGTALENLGVVLVNAHREADAVPILDRAIAELDAGGLTTGAAGARVQRAIAETPTAIGDPRATARLRAELAAARAVLAKRVGDDDPDVADADAALADVLARTGACREAAPLVVRALAVYDKTHAPAFQRERAEAARRRCAP